MMSSESDQRSSTNLLGLHEFQLYRQHFAIFQEDQLNFRKFPVFPGFPGAVDIPLKMDGDGFQSCGLGVGLSGDRNWR